MKKFLISEMYLVTMIIACTLKLAGLISFSWASILVVPTVVAVSYKILVMAFDGELVYYFTKFVNKAAENKLYFKK